MPVTSSSPVTSDVQDFIQRGILSFKEHELREIVAAFCKIPGIASQPATPTGGEVDLTNHHNALKCPYCNPQGLEFAPAQSSADSAALTDGAEINLGLLRQLREAFDGDSIPHKNIALRKAYAACDKLLRSPDEAVTPGEPVAWTNEAQLGYLKEESCKDIPMAMWATPLGAADIPLYRNDAQPSREAPRANEDQVKDLILKHCTVNEKKVLLRTVWRDGIDIDRPRTCIMNIADELLALSTPSTDRGGK